MFGVLKWHVLVTIIHNLNEADTRISLEFSVCTSSNAIYTEMTNCFGPNNFVCVSATTIWAIYLDNLKKSFSPQQQEGEQAESFQQDGAQLPLSNFVRAATQLVGWAERVLFRRCQHITSLDLLSCGT
jgi:hypothetical protein